ncbi:hypothetical protein HDU98_004064 [Podochytrium sp. JEL0797]|nr:hypothetical protein HDU98_004064 [Podochytrium sp. JEL0797]
MTANIKNKIELLTGPLNATEWKRDLIGLSCSKGLFHCLDISCYNEINGLHGNHRLAGQELADAIAEDPERIHHAFVTDQIVFAMHRGQVNAQKSFPGTLAENHACILLITQNLSRKYQLNMITGATSAYSQLSQIMASVTNIDPSSVSTICKTLAIWKMEAHESISTMMSRFRTAIIPVMTNPELRGFATYAEFEHQKELILEGLVPALHSQRFRVSENHAILHLNDLEAALMKIAKDVEYTPADAVSNYTQPKPDKRTDTPQQLQSLANGTPAPPRTFTYNPLAARRNDPRPDYICKICKKKGDHFSWQCRKDTRYKEFKRAHDAKTGKRSNKSIPGKPRNIKRNTAPPAISNMAGTIPQGMSSEDLGTLRTLTDSIPEQAQNAYRDFVNSMNLDDELASDEVSESESSPEPADF